MIYTVLYARFIAFSLIYFENVSNIARTPPLPVGYGPIKSIDTISIKFSGLCDFPGPLEL